MNLLNIRPPKHQCYSDRRVRILNFLNEHMAGVLSTVDPDSNPHAAVVYFSVKPDFTVTFLTKRRTKKSDNLRHNNHVMLAVFDEVLQTSVQIKGVASEITDTDKAHEVFRSMLRASLRTSENGVPPISKLSAGEYVAYTIKPVEVAMSVYSRPDVHRNEHLRELLDLSSD